MCLKSECVYFSQFSGCVLSPCVHILHSLTQAGHNCLMVMTVPSVKVLHGSPRSCLETSIPPKSCLCGCRSQRLHNSALLEPTGDSCLHSSMMLAVQKPEVSLLPHAFLPSPFLKCAGRREIAARQNFCTKSECCATRWNLHSVVSEMAFFCWCGALFQVFWFYFSCLTSLCSERAAVFAGLTFREHKVGWSGLPPVSPQIWSELPHHLRLNLSFPVLVFWVLVLL